MTLPKKGLKTRRYSMHMDMKDHTVTLPKKGLKTRPYSMDMNKDIETLPKKGLKTRPYNIGMEKMDLKTRPYSTDMEKKDLKKLTKGQLIKLLLKKFSNHEDLLDNNPFKDEVAQEPTTRYSMHMDMKDHTVTLPKKGLKTRPYSMDMNKDIETLPKKGLKTRPYNIGMEKMDLKTRPYSTDMEKKDLKKLTKGQLIKLLLKKFSNHEDLLDNNPFKDEVAQEPTTPPRTGKCESVKPKPIPRKSVNEDLILPPPDGYKPIPKPRTDRPLKMQNARRPPKPTRKPPPIPQVEDHTINVPVPKIKELNRALKGHAKSYEIELQDNLNPLNHFTKTKTLVESHLENLLKDMKGFKFIETLELTFEKDTIDSKTGKCVSIYKTAFFNGKAKTITKVDDIEPELNMSRQEILNVIDK